MGFARLVQFLLEQCANGFYGTVTIQFRKGAIGIVRTEQTFDVKDLPVKDADAVALMQNGRIAVPT